MGRDETTSSEYHERAAGRVAEEMKKKKATRKDAKGDVAKGDVTGDGGKSEQTVEGEESGGSEEADHLALGDGK
jgi:hypothetical protein